MKKYYIALYMLIILCIVGSSVILIISPDTIPLHYNFKGEVDRWGTKYESLLFPIITVILGVLLTVVPKVQRKKENASNEKIMLIAGVITVAFFDALTFYLGIKAIALSDTEGGFVVPSIGKFIGISMGALLVLLGNIIPKVRKNAAFGLRTKWSMVNDRVWQKSQRFSGIAAVIILKTNSISHILTEEQIYDILSEDKPNQKDHVRFRCDDLKRFFPEGCSSGDMSRTIVKLLERWSEQREKKQNKDAR